MFATNSREPCAKARDKLQRSDDATIIVMMAMPRRYLIKIIIAPDSNLGM
ncbi:MAG: hypothetical protein ACJAVI_003361 [Candidatus Azotimanducaceae bacterium]|jgi:hypothetical protein